MNEQELAQKLFELPKTSRNTLLEENGHLLNSELGKALQQICYELWTEEPQKVSTLVKILEKIAKFTGNREFDAYQEWTKAIENLVNGKPEDCLKWLDKSEKTFLSLNLTHSAATTQISKLYALALLGRYDEAVVCGLRAREVFSREKDFYSVGKIEHNIGNLYWRRDFYRESEPYLASAHKHFEQIGDHRQLAMVENCQAFVAALQNRFREAETIYQKSLKRAEEHNLIVTEAEIEIGLSNLYLFQGRFNLALKFLERSRRKYDLLKMPHQSANCELEIADIYLELNLLPEAAEYYEKVEEKFAELGMQAELGRSLLNHAKTQFALEQTQQAIELLEKAENVFSAEGNPISQALAKLVKVQSLFRSNDLTQAEKEIQSALQTFAAAGNVRYQLFANWHFGEILLRRNEFEKATAIFYETLDKSIEQSKQIEYLCLISLGGITGEESWFLRAVDLVENSRAALSSEEFRTAFFSDKLRPYNELVKIKFAEEKLVEALTWHERSRARTMFEAITADSKNASSNSKLTKLREELNWFYSRINRQTSSGLEARKEVFDLRKQAAERERELAELERRVNIGSEISNLTDAKEFQLSEFQALLDEASVIEFTVIDRKLSAFIITKDSFDVFHYSIDTERLKSEIEQFLFQIKTGRFLKNLSGENQRVSYQRLLRRANAIYDILLQPLKKIFDATRIVFVPSGFLHHFPFQALHDGEHFLIENHEISFAPSLAVLQHCLSRKILQPNSALLVGVADEKAPQIEAEIEIIGKLFKNPVRLKNSEATIKNLRENIEQAEILHLACHGNFRVDNPSFSALNLFTENLTMRDVQNLNLQNKTVILSACETGLNKIVNGEESLGLMRGFLQAGASSLVFSLWTVDDKSTLDLMTRLYRNFLNGDNLSRSLQAAQKQVLKENPHPYFWAPFVIIGHW